MSFSVLSLKVFYLFDLQGIIMQNTQIYNNSVITILFENTQNIMLILFWPEGKRQIWCHVLTR